MMAIRLLATVALLMAGALLLRAQDYPENPLDGPVMKSDSLEIKPQPLSPALQYVPPVPVDSAGMIIFEKKYGR